MTKAQCFRLDFLKRELSDLITNLSRVPDLIH